MSEEAVAVSPEAPAQPAVGRGARTGAVIIATLIVLSLILYFVGDRITPYTSQARVQAFVVPIAAEASGKVRRVHVRNDVDVEAGQTLFELDPEQYQIALQSARSNYETIRRTVNASVAAVEAARASLRAAQAGFAMAEKDASRQERLHAEDPGAISVRRLEIAQATREEARSQVRKAEADLRKAEESAGDRGENNAQLQTARAAVEKAELDLERTKVVSPARGRVTDLRVDVGNFTQAGAPVMTLIAVHDVWISADMTENNLGHIEPGDEVAIVLDVMPGKVLEGRVRSVGGGVSSGQSSPVGTLPTVENSRDWLRQAQRIPVAIEFDKDEIKRLRNIRVGGQAEVLVFTGDHAVMNLFARIYIRVMSWLSYLY
jgi:multidrug resistance efflux pump